MERHDAIALATGPNSPWELQDVDVRGSQQKWFVNGPQSLRELYETNLSDDPFYVFQEERYTFKEIYQSASNLAFHMRKDLGVKAGDRVAIAMRNYPEWPIALEAITSLGAIAVAINAWWQADEIEYALDLTGTSVVIADQDRIERISQISSLSRLNVIAVRDEGSKIGSPIGPLMQGEHQMPPADIAADDDAVILFTSGSTGYPKGSVSTQRNILAALLSWELDFVAMTMISSGASIDEDEVRKASQSQKTALLAMPLFHVNGLHAVLLSAFRTQRKIVGMFKWDAEKAADLIEAESVATIVGTPAMTGDLIEYVRRSGRTLPSLQSAGGGGAARATSQVEGISTLLKNAAPFTGWGMTETNSIGTGIYGKDYQEHPSSSGRCSMVLEIGTIDSEGALQPRGTRGELVIRGTSVIHGYWNRPDANQESFIDGWFRTGDIAYIDDEGYLFIVDRLKQLIIRGGENIGCGEVEDALLDHPNIIEASVYGVPDERLGEAVAASVFTDSPIEVSDVTDFLESRLAKFKIPQFLFRTDSQLPRIASGKIDKKVLRSAHIDQLGL